MKILTGVLICAVVFFTNPAAVAAEFNVPPAESVAQEFGGESMPPVMNMENPASPNSVVPGIPMDPGMPEVLGGPTAEVAPVLTVPVEMEPAQPIDVEFVPALESSEDVIIDSHIVIEEVPVVTRPAPKDTRNAFARIKHLAGRWEGSGAGNDAVNENQEKVVVTYEVTAGGYAVLERIFPGTPQEIVTMYYEQDGYLTLMHFSLIGTRSLMTLEPISEDTALTEQNTFQFNLAQKAGIDPVIDSHMHSLKITFSDENHIKQEWSMYEAGNQSGAYSFKLNRVVVPDPAAQTPSVAGD